MLIFRTVFSARSEAQLLTYGTALSNGHANFPRLRTRRGVGASDSPSDLGSTQRLKMTGSSALQHAASESTSATTYSGELMPMSLSC